MRFISRNGLFKRVCEVLKPFTFLVLVLWLLGCEDEKDFKPVSFWTDKSLVDEDFRFLYVNDELLGELPGELSEPDCDTEGIISYELPIQQRVEISVRSAANESIVIASIDAENASSGISVNTDNRAVNSEIRLADGNGCTLIYLSW